MSIRLYIHKTPIMSQLQATLQSNLSDIRYDQVTGISYGSIRLAARLAGTSDTAIHKGANSTTSKLSKYLTSKGFDTANLKDGNGLSADLITAICSYYALHAGRWVNDIAKLTLEWFAQIGLSVAIKACFVSQPNESLTEEIENASPELFLLNNQPMSGNTYLDDIQRHLKEVSILRKQIKSEYDSDEDKDERDAMLGVLKNRTIAFCDAFQLQVTNTGVVTDAIKSPTQEPLTPYQARKLARSAEIVEFVKRNPTWSTYAVGKKFAVSDRTVYVYCRDANVAVGK